MKFKIASVDEFCVPDWPESSAESWQHSLCGSLLFILEQKKMKVENKHLLQSTEDFIFVDCYALFVDNIASRIKLIYFPIFALKNLKEILQTVPPSETCPVPSGRPCQ
jgi:hypothetical protein